MVVELLNPPPPKERPRWSEGSLHFRVLTLKRFLPCIVGSRNSDIGQGCANV